MKLLHTSDLHLGHQLFGYDRTEEQQSMLEQIEEIVRTQMPDVLLVCGDVYHVSQPSSAVQTMFTEAIVRMHLAHPEMVIVITAGNHDSATRHEIFQAPWKALNVHAVGNINRDDASKQIIEIPGKGFVAAVPYVSGRNLPENYYNELLDRVAQVNTEGLPVVLTAHTTVAGCDFSGHDSSTSSERTVGGIDSFDISTITGHYDYLALGHIHRSQKIGDRGRYCGTPLAVSFDESYAHSVTIVELENGAEAPVISTVDIANPRPLVTLPTQGFTEWEEAVKLLQDYPSDIPAYIRLNVLVKDFLPVGAQAQAVKIAEDKSCRFCLVNSRRMAVETKETGAMTVQEFREEEPINVAMRYAKSKGIEFDESMTELFSQVLASVEDDKRNS